MTEQERAENGREKDGKSMDNEVKEKEKTNGKVLMTCLRMEITGRKKIGQSR